MLQGCLWPRCLAWLLSACPSRCSAQRRSHFLCANMYRPRCWTHPLPILCPPLAECTSSPGVRDCTHLTSHLPPPCTPAPLSAIHPIAPPLSPRPTPPRPAQSGKTWFVSWAETFTHVCRHTCFDRNLVVQKIMHIHVGGLPLFHSAACH